MNRPHLRYLQCDVAVDVASDVAVDVAVDVAKKRGM
jgi:hypothetical protein